MLEGFLLRAIRHGHVDEVGADAAHENVGAEAGVRGVVEDALGLNLGGVACLGVDATKPALDVVMPLTRVTASTAHRGVATEGIEGDGAIAVLHRAVDSSASEIMPEHKKLRSVELAVLHVRALHNTERGVQKGGGAFGAKRVQASAVVGVGAVEDGVEGVLVDGGGEELLVDLHVGVDGEAVGFGDEEVVAGDGILEERLMRHVMSG